ncbi:metallophosphoesterase [Streptomyces sp. NPDC053499]|uniref:metallophosphoesterase n=1 Tax=Streptomyces sp. NPDC053499 TaxID=3365707 RepID=UPI0037D6FD1C
MVEGSMTQGAGQGPDVWHGGTTTHGAGTAPALSAAAQDAAVAAGPRAVAGPSDPRSAPPAVAPGVPGPVRADPRTPLGAPTGRAAAPETPVREAPAPQASAPQGSVRSESVPNEPAPAGPGEDYTPTARDLPVVGAMAAAKSDGPEPTMVDVPVPAGSANDGEGPLYVVGDVHGYLDELRTALRQFGIIDAEGHWIAGNARLWFLGDFTDRGPDGIGVIELVMQLSAEAAAAGGYCKALMGNHELLLLGAKRFGDTPVNSGAGTASFQAAWLLNGGQRTDMERLADHHVQWMSRLDAIALADNHLLVHSDATCYLDYGDTIEDVNDAITEALQRNDAEETWDLFRKFTKRFAFREETAGPAAVRELLDAFGGKRIVHGHSPIPYLLGEVDSEDGESAPDVTGPHVYADGLAVAMDGGVTMAGKLLIARLPLVQ